MTKKIVQKLRRALPGSASSTPTLKRKLCRTSASGFTLIETMVTVVIFAVVMSFALGIFLSTVRSQRVAMHRQRLITETTHTMSRIKEAIKEDKEHEVDDFYSDQAITINKFTYPDEYSGEDMVTILLEAEIKIGEDDKKEEFRLQTTVLKEN